MLGLNPAACADHPPPLRPLRWLFWTLLVFLRRKLTVRSWTPFRGELKTFLQLNRRRCESPKRLQYKRCCRIFHHLIPFLSLSSSAPPLCASQRMTDQLQGALPPPAGLRNRGKRGNNKKSPICNVNFLLRYEHTVWFSW